MVEISNELIIIQQIKMLLKIPTWFMSCEYYNVNRKTSSVNCSDSLQVYRIYTVAYF